MGNQTVVIQEKKKQEGLWLLEDVQRKLDRPLNDLLYEAQTIHRLNFDANTIQLSTLVSIKTGGCPEDCSYCSQSARHDSEIENSSLMEIDELKEAANIAKKAGAERFCMGAAWRSVRDKDIDELCEMIEEVKGLGLETCMTLGMLNTEQAEKLSAAGLDYYNHNLDTSEEFYSKIVSTRSYQDRIDTLAAVRETKIKVCCGGILGLGEEEIDRARLLMNLANMQPPPESVPINVLVKMKGTPFEGNETIDNIDVVKTIAVARIMLPGSYIRLSAGRKDMSEEMQALCFAAGANSVFYGEKLLTTENPDLDKDKSLFKKLGLKTVKAE